MKQPLPFYTASSTRILTIALLVAFLLLFTSSQAQTNLTVSTFAGNSFGGYANGTGRSALFSAPIGLAIDANDNLYVADFHNHVIRKITPTGVTTTYAGSIYGYVDGPALYARFYGPAGVAADAAGNVYVADYGNHRIRKIDASGQVTTLAGSGANNSVDGVGTAASFSYPSGVAVDKAGNVYVLDTGTSRVRKIDVNRRVTTLAGDPSNYQNGALFDFHGVAPQPCVDANGNVYLADPWNNRIRKVAPNGTVTNVAGSWDYGTTDGPALSASFSSPTAVTLDRQGNLIVGDWHAAKVRKVDLTAQLVSTVAGNGDEAHVDGPALRASFVRPGGVAVDSKGNIFVSDYYDNCIRKIGANTVTPPLSRTLVNPSFEEDGWSGWSINSIAVEGGPSITTDYVTEGAAALKFSASGRALNDSCLQALSLAPGNYTLTCDAKTSIGTVATLGIINANNTQGPTASLGSSLSGKLTVNFTVTDSRQPTTIYFTGKQARYLRSWVIVDTLVLMKN
ncbi:MAG: NHL repeat-containing protein [Blastocatellia bacterium]